MTNGYNNMQVNYLFQCKTTQNTTVSKNKLDCTFYRSSGSCCEARIKE